MATFLIEIKSVDLFGNGAMKWRPTLADYATREEAEKNAAGFRRAGSQARVRQAHPSEVRS